MDSTHSSTQRSLRPAAVLAGVGTFLLVAAALSFVTARWDRFGPGDRFAALLVASALVFGLGLTLRRLAPVTARSLDVLMAALVPVDVAALAIVSGAQWPAVLMAAGPAAMVAAEGLRRRGPIAISEFGTVLGGLLALCGVAASFDVALSPLVAVLGLAGCVVSPWARERVAGMAWAALAGLAPALRVLDEVAFTGDGTLRRLGLLDATPWTATLIAGGVSLIALSWSAVSRRSLFVAVTAAGVFVATAAAMWSEHQPPRSLLVVAAAILVALAEIGLTHRVTDRMPTLRESASGVVSTLNGSLTLVVAALASGIATPASQVVGPEWAYAAATLAFAWLVSDLRRMRDDHRTTAEGGGWAPATWGTVLSALSAVALISTPTVTAIVALATGSVMLLTRRAGRLSVAWLTAALGPCLLVDDWRLALGGATVGVVVVALSSLAGRRTYDELLGAQGVAGVSVPIGIAAASIGADSVIGAGLAVLALCWIAAVIVDVALPGAALALRGIGLVALVATASGDATLAALGLFASALLWLAHLAATRQRSSLVVAGWSTVVGFSVLTFDVAADATVLLAWAVASGGVALIGWGLDRDLESARFGGGFIVWWASLVGLAGAGVASVEPYAYPILAILGWAIHRDGSADSGRARWVSVAVPMVGALVIAFGQRVAVGNAGHTLFLGVVALGLCVAGGVRQHQPALVIGAAATVAIGAFEALDQVVGIESWSWLVVTGASALTVAAALEVTDREQAAVTTRQ